MSSLVVAEKTCTKCGKTKPLSEFYRARTNADGLRNDCKTCAIARVREAREKRMAAMGEDAFRAMLAADQRARRRLNDEASDYDRRYMRARHRATAALIDRHRDEFDHLLLLARRGELA